MVELIAKNRTAEEGTDIVQKKVDEEETNNAEIGDQFWIYSGQRLEVERPKEELEKQTNTLRDMIENVREFQLMPANLTVPNNYDVQICEKSSSYYCKNSAGQRVPCFADQELDDLEEESRTRPIPTTYSKYLDPGSQIKF